jgi:hypothetical protein
MKGNRAVLIVVVVLLVAIGIWWWFRPGRGSGTVDLMTQFDKAQKKPDPAAFTIVDATLNGETKKAIAPPPGAGTRVTWKLRIPNDGWLKVDLGLKPEAWQQDGDGVLFMVGVSDGRTFEGLFTQQVNPFGNQVDRRWIPVMVDLSAYGGEEVEVIFNTFASAPGKPPDPRNDLALWGAPEIVIR